MIDLLIVGPLGGTHIAGSIARAASELGLSTQVEDTSEAYQGPSIPKAIAWRFGDRKPYRITKFATRIASIIDRQEVRRLLCVGQCPLTSNVIELARRRGTKCLVFSTDDPWNPAHRAEWYLQSLPCYDAVFTPRRSNIEELRSLGCRDVSYLPFGYDPELFPAGEPQSSEGVKPEVLCVGGADADRRRFIAEFVASGGRPTLVGGYWDRYPETRHLTLGLKTPSELRRLTVSADVNLCLVRRANRDGHVMRSFEIPALGGFLIAEDTADHRAIFGDEGSSALYFNSAREAAEKAKWAVNHPAERLAMARATHMLVTKGGHTYKDRLVAMLERLAV